MKWDAIFIGSGMGTLAAASALAEQRGFRCLVLERHFKAGGFTHAFRRPGGFAWDVGVHYVGGVGPGMEIRRLYDYLSVHRLAWHPMPDDYDVYDYPDLRFPVPSRVDAFIDRLSAQFPEERRGIRGHFRDLKRAAKFFNLNIAKPLVPAGIAPFLGLLSLPHRSLALSTVEAALNRRIRNPDLRTLLASTWGNYGLPPHLAAFAVHSVIATHYHQGGWYPVGGGDAIWTSIWPRIENAGGRVLLSSQVTEILLEGGRAVGVRYRSPHGSSKEVQEARAPWIISDAGAALTYGTLLPEAIGRPVTEAIRRIKESTPCVTLYLGLKGDPKGLGVKGENYWIYSHRNHRDSHQNRKASWANRPDGAFLSFPSLKDPTAEAHTAEILAFPPPDTFNSWHGTRWKRRGPEYDSFKEQIGERLLDLVEQRIPGLKALTHYRELSTPLTTEDFLGHPGGTIYGVPSVPERFSMAFLTPKTPVPGLVLTGADAGLSGITGAMMGGLSAAATILGPGGWLKIMKASERT